MGTPEYGPGRLKQLRLREGLTQVEFAEVIGSSQYHVSRMEQGIEPIPVQVLAKATRKFELPAEYFSRPAHMYGRASLNFRRTKMPAKLQDRISAHFAELEEMIQQTQLQIPQAGIAIERPESEDELSLEVISKIADSIRSTLRLGGGPVGNVTRAMESAGIVVAPLKIEGLSLDEFEGVSSPQPNPRIRVTAYAPSRSGDRHRFTLAHELGHLVLHALRRPNTESVRESEAHKFAGAFLLPQELIADSITETTTLAQFAKIKSKTGVSIQAIVRRARDLSLISQERHKSLMIQISSRGWRKEEPVVVQMEREILFPRIVEELESRNVVSIFTPKRR
ncbi:ImmA/IrrE family metallo-endopeptidase [Corynebacterium sp.]|uniref:ImmA/IrrE family metallo-endopeptidase n=1 Tax=Corynebacterium sp. TaxID=1720 RepID=UPI0026DA93D0|nr:XRE family transcriptional regulator [Corynebacterium sp.]MDO5031929.1 XRE family transcriptional regulator [Corynebacterium sp.]